MSWGQRKRKKRGQMKSSCSNTNTGKEGEGLFPRRDTETRGKNGKKDLTTGQRGGRQASFLHNLGRVVSLSKYCRYPMKPPRPRREKGGETV